MGKIFFVAIVVGEGRKTFGEGNRGWPLKWRKNCSSGLLEAEVFEDVEVSRDLGLLAAT